MHMKLSRKTNEALEAYIMLLPTVIGFLIISAGPIIAALLLSFTDYDFFKWPPNWVGLKNYVDLFNLPLFSKIVINTLYYCLLTIIPSAFFGLLLASILNIKITGITIFRGIFFWPVIASMAAVSLTWVYLLNPQIGLVNYILQFINIKGLPWLGSTTWAMPSLALVFVWKWVGFYMIILLAGLQDIPNELYESSMIEGANIFHKMRYITLPMISPTLFFVFIMATIASFQIFDQIFIMTNNAGPAYSTLTLSYYVYQNAFQWLHMGFACTVGVILFLIIFIFSFIQIRSQNKWVFYR